MRKYLILVLAFTLLGCHRDESPPAQPADAEADATALDADSRAILDAALKDLLTNPDLEDARTFYGEKNGRLVAYYVNYFPKGYAPSVPGFQFVRYAGDREAPPDAPRLLVIDLRWFRGQPTRLPPDDQACRALYKDWDGVELTIFNGGGAGDAHGVPIGGCSMQV